MRSLAVFLIVVAGCVKYLYMEISTRNVPIRYSTVEYIQFHGYSVENHFIKTSDGYILNVHRIPAAHNVRTNGKIVLLEHGMFLTSAQWVILGPHKALAYLLADEGYDVWMTNLRGNEYSRYHTTLNPDTDSQFWDFTWHEIGVYDLRATVDYILNRMNTSSIYHVGYSQGSAILHILLSTLPDYNIKIKAYVNLGPAVFLNNLKSLIFKIPANILSVLGDWIPIRTSTEMSSSKSFIHMLQDAICAQGIGTVICENVMYIVAGFSRPEMNKTLVPAFSHHVFTGASLKQFIHVLQMINSGYFRQYDYGESGNQLRYERPTPPDYDLNKVTSPGCVMYSANDLMVDHENDVPRLCNALGNCVEKYLIPSETFNHFDFLIGNSAPSTLYANVIRFLSQY